MTDNSSRLQRPLYIFELKPGICSGMSLNTVCPPDFLLGSTPFIDSCASFEDVGQLDVGCMREPAMISVGLAILFAREGASRRELTRIRTFRLGRLGRRQIDSFNSVVRHV